MQHLTSVVICVFCMPVAMRLLILVQRTDGIAKRAHIMLTILLLGASIWATQMTFFLTLFAGHAHLFDLLNVIAALVLSTSGVAVAIWVSRAQRDLQTTLFCGALFGLTGVATLLFVVTNVSPTAQYAVRPFFVIALCVFGMGLGLATFFVAAKVSLIKSWHLISVAFAATILIPQHVITFGMKEVLSQGVRIAVLPISQDTLFAILTATVAVFLMWSLAAFVAEAHEKRVRHAVLRDATLLDPLTDLPNRLRLEQHFAALREQGKRGYLYPAAVIMFNLDGFKSINELHGNSCGDRILKEVAYRLSLQSGDSEFVARIGGDEFVVVLNHVSETHVAETFAKDMLDRINQPVTVARSLVRPRASVGYALLPQDGQTFDELMVKAEVALKRAKASVSQKVQRFDPEMDQQERDKSAMLQDLSGAADRGELFLNYQMQHDIQTEELSGFEVLLRWNHPKKGPISPAVFIPLAEQSGLIRAIGTWVLQQACIEAASWHRPYSIAVNVAPQQLLEAGFTEMVETTLDETGLPANRLELEITEASIIEDEEATLEVMHRLRNMGIRIAMDDFGTGYSSLAMLQAFPFDKIKIDRSFVINVHENPDRAAIIQATVLIGEAMAIPVLVEGVENRDELTFLRRAKCHIVQGFIFGKPLDTQAVRKLALIPDQFRAVFR